MARAFHRTRTLGLTPGARARAGGVEGQLEGGEGDPEGVRGAAGTERGFGLGVAAVQEVLRARRVVDGDEAPTETRRQRVQ